MNDQVRQWLMRRAAQAAPHEACGFVMDDGSIVEIRNVSPYPARRFAMDRQQVYEKIGDRIDAITGVWHTHPSGIPKPTATDIESIARGAVQRHWRYFIATAQEVQEYATNRFAPQDDSFWEAFSSSSARTG